ncbi:hypothetical protein CEXT_136411 [Caerostris extrusa]|uniref:Uncharacterized protein n=1 Tax=Caerostris extrusa TaxID=172846 RepID=A0AAV4U2K0_CAEEX|nr:hypothetical protein CEXT_136411 [Caerostris extrusa]
MEGCYKASPFTCCNKVEVVSRNRRKFLGLSREHPATPTIHPVPEQWSFQPPEDVCGSLAPTLRSNIATGKRRVFHPPPTFLHPASNSPSSTVSFWLSRSLETGYDFLLIHSEDGRRLDIFC